MFTEDDIEGFISAMKEEHMDEFLEAYLMTFPSDRQFVLDSTENSIRNILKHKETRYES